MKLSCSRDALLDGLQVVSRAVSPRATVQILAGIRISVAAGTVELAATDMEISLRARMPADTVEEGVAVVPGRLLTDIVRLLPVGEVVLEQDGETGVVHVRAGVAEYSLNAYAASDFPRLPEVERDAVIALDREAFLETVAKVGRAASRDESRPVLTGILVRVDGPTLVMAATDSYRLSVKETALPSSAPRALEAIVPSRALAEVARIGQGGTGDEIELGVQENQVVFVVDGVVATARRIDGQFPNYAQLRPDTFEAELVLPREELLDAVRRVSVMAQRNSPLRLRFADGELILRAQTQDVGEARESLPVAYAGEPLEIGFNPDFLREGLESVGDAEVRLRLISPLRPGLISGAGEDFWYLIMPIRLSG